MLLISLILFADDTNLFFNYKNIKDLFTVVNNKLVNIKDWFNANKLFLNMEKTKYSFFHLACSLWFYYTALNMERTHKYYRK